MKKTIFFYQLIIVGIPVALLLAEVICGVAPFSVLIANLSLSALLSFLLTGSLGGLILYFGLQKIRRENYVKGIFILQVFILTWGPLAGFLFSFFYHINSNIGNTPEMIFASTFFSSAVGLFFSILMISGTSDELDSCISVKEGSQIITSGMRFKIIISIGFVIIAFWAGTTGAMLMMSLIEMPFFETVIRVCILVIPFLGVTSLLVLFMLKSTTAPLLTSLPKIEALGKDDLTQHLETSWKDETGLLFKTLNRFIKHLAHSISLIRTKNEDTRSRGEQLLVSMEQSSQFSNEVNQNAETVKDTVLAQVNMVENVSSSVEAIVGTIEKQDNRISEQSAGVTQSSAAIEEMIASVHSIFSNIDNNTTEFDRLQNNVETGNKNLNEMANLVKEIEEKSMKVNQANEIITSISSKTNLLAMNAAIEAAHAGEAGKGFSVVAEEIRKLAETSDKQSKQISMNIKSLGVAINATTVISENTKTSFGEIQSSVEKVTQIEDQMKLSLDELSSGSTEILHALSEISTITSEVHEGSTIMVDRGNITADEISNLVVSTNLVKEQTLAIIEKMARINESVNLSTHGVKETVLGVEEIQTEIARFKLE